MKVKELVTETSVFMNYESSTKIHHSFWPLAAKRKPQIFAHKRPVLAGADHQPLTAGVKRTGQPPLYPRTWRFIFFVSNAGLFTLISSWAEVWWLQKQPWECMTCTAQQCPRAVERAQQSALKEEETKSYLAFREMWGPEATAGLRPHGKYFFLWGQVR